MLSKELNCGRIGDTKLNREKHTQIKFNDTEVSLNREITENYHSNTGVTAGIGVGMEEDAGMERHVGGIGTHVAALADDDRVEDLLDKL